MAQLVCFADLPPELVTNVFAFVRLKAHQRNVSLVSRAWKDIMYPLMWETFSNDMCSTSTKTLETLLHPDSGILRHVKELDLEFAVDATTENNLRLLITALPRDALCRFESLSLVGFETIQILLQCHRKLKTFQSPGPCYNDDTPEAIWSHQDHLWMKPLLRQITDLSLWDSAGREVADQVRQDFSFLISSTPRLEKLSINGSRRFHDGVIEYLSLADTVSDWAADVDVSNLTFVQLSDLNLDAPTGFTSKLKLCTLRTLYIVRCVHIQPLLVTLAEWYSSNTGNLTEVAFELEDDDQDKEETIQALENFLTSCFGFRHLEVYGQVYRSINVEAIVRHGTTLSTLILGSEDQSGVMQHYPVPDIKMLLDGCPKLKYLAINLPNVDLGNVEDLAENLDLGVESGSQSSHERLCSVLAALSEHLPLHTLRMLNLPNIDYQLETNPNPSLSNFVSIDDNDAKLCRVIMQTLATQIFKYMVSRRSNIRMFVAQPTCAPNKQSRPARDINGHQWPEYFYMRGWQGTVRGQEETIGIALRGAKVEMPESKVLDLGF